MKKLKLISTLIVTGFITMSMGFPTDLLNGRITDEREEETCPFASVSNVIVMTKAESGKEENIQKAPIRELSFSNISNAAIIVKVFDPKGSLVMTQQVSMDDFLAGNDTLPTGSTFVMLHENTAYYFLEAGLMN